MPDAISYLETVLRILAFIVFYVIIGFGPGFILGVLLANGTVGRGKPHRVDKHKEAIERAVEHNKQWHPDDPRWQQ